MVLAGEICVLAGGRNLGISRERGLLQDPNPVSFARNLDLRSSSATPDLSKSRGRENGKSFKMTINANHGISLNSLILAFRYVPPLSKVCPEYVCGGRPGETD